MKRTLLMVIVGAALGGAAALVACGDGTTMTTNTGGGDVTMAKGDFHDFVANKLTLPTTREQFSIDLDGDGKSDNALANIINVLGSQMLYAQDGVDQSLANGDVVFLFSVQSSDATLQKDETAGVTLYIGKPMPAQCQKDDAGHTFDGGTCSGGPDFSGMGMFAVDGVTPPSSFLGKIGGGTFKSNNPVKAGSGAGMVAPVKAQLKLALVAGAPPVSLPVNGAHIQFTSSGGKLADGSLQGSVKITDLQNSVLPAVAGFLTERIKSDPSGATSKSIKDLFDTGGCGTAMKGDNTIDVCELATADLIKNLLSADIQVFTPPGSDTYAPVPKSKSPDSLSLGIGFTAVGAKIMK